ncbi:uncharacterized protein BX664DRAFT_343369 [Halteromyces radiatus]|uniref:uncharacterized protein n=1 Tax=Halteromyces radiatus TaxID=101107 RepID=UPI00221F2954|nr:uncharacterized protein BX664DRAFT_343369 [Halteromyces radiatus]KAI8077735.1 hypothetical protein BX664DRAFT_343369 [Halteromyces radiatus]
MAIYLYKNQYKDITIFASCEWLNDIDFTNSIDRNTSICKLVIYNVPDFYRRLVTFQDLEDFKQGDIPLDVLNTVVTLALQGGKEYKGDELNWKTVFTRDECQMTLIGYWNRTLPVQVGSFKLQRVPEWDKNSILTEWMENTSSQFKLIKETQDALSLRNLNLEEEYKKMEESVEQMVAQKTISDLSMMGKFKELLNQKKKKIRNLMVKLEQKEIKPDTTIPSSISSSIKRSVSPPSSSSKGKKKQKTEDTQSEESSRPIIPMSPPSNIPQEVQPSATFTTTTNNDDHVKTDEDEDDNLEDDWRLTIARSRPRSRGIRKAYVIIIIYLIIFIHNDDHLTLFLLFCSDTEKNMDTQSDTTDEESS